jgi:hypothetical protein
MIILVDIDGEQFTDPEPGLHEGHDEHMVSQPLTRPRRFPHTKRLRGIEQPELLETGEPFPLRLLFLRRFHAVGRTA